MAFDRYERDMRRDERSQRSDNRDRDRGWGGEHRSHERDRDDRGFWDRASDEVASWFGDDEAERRRREDQMREERERGFSGRRRDFGPERSEHRRDWYETRGSNDRGGFNTGDYSRSWRGELTGRGNRERDWDRERSRDYRPMTGNYGSAGRDRDFDRSQSPWGEDECSTSRAGTSDWSDRSRHEDTHY